MSEDPLAYFGFSCPKGGRFYICEGSDTEFVGCCTSNPCEDGSGECPEDDLRAATFAPDTYEDLPPQDCESGTLFYTCAFTSPPFFGCCAENACADPSSAGCAASDLGAIELAPEGVKDEARRNGLLNPSGEETETGSGTETETPTSTAESTPTLITGISEEVGDGGGGGGGLSTGAIVGIVVGCCAVITILVAILFFKCGWGAAKKRRQSQPPPPPDQLSTHHQQYAPPMSEAGYSGDGGYPPSQLGSPPLHPTSPYQDSMSSSATYAQDPSLYNKQYSPYQPSPRPVSLESSQQPDWAGSGHRRHYSQPSGLGVNMVAVQELDSTGVVPPNELSAGGDGVNYSR